MNRHSLSAVNGFSITFPTEFELIYDRIKQFFVEKLDLSDCNTKENILECISKNGYSREWCKTVRIFRFGGVFRFDKWSNSKVISTFWDSAMNRWDKHHTTSPVSLDDLAETVYHDIFFEYVSAKDLLESIAEEIIEDRNKEMVL